MTIGIKLREMQTDIFFPLKGMAKACLEGNTSQPSRMTEVTCVLIDVDSIDENICQNWSNPCSQHLTGPAHFELSIHQGSDTSVLELFFFLKASKIPCLPLCESTQKSNHAPQAQPLPLFILTFPNKGSHWPGVHFPQSSLPASYTQIATVITASSITSTGNGTAYVKQVLNSWATFWVLFFHLSCHWGKLDVHTLFL